MEVNSNGEIFVSIENTADAVGLVEEIQELDPENKYAKQVQDYLFSTEEAAGGDDEDEEVDEAGRPIHPETSVEMFRPKVLATLRPKSLRDVPFKRRKP